ncbi:TraR/DksA family transcriptional regulator [Streptomyces sp. NPDC006784]|uniref:TraR/DksA family transcriptional regulator n=1 Tax=Streptomyces sp. NPDC006784 TaxID=3364764 RepID=UPI003693A6FB
MPGRGVAVAPFVADSPHDPALSPAARAAARELLLAERAGTGQQIAALSREFEQIVEANALIAIDDEHDPEGSSTAFERAHVAALLTRAREHLVEVDRALERLERGDYGRCTECGVPIPEERLSARPAAITCVRCAAARHT